MTATVIGLVALGALFSLFCGWRFWFFHRNPPRRIPPGDALLSPADGSIVYCESVDLDASSDPYHRRVGDALGMHGSYDVVAIYLSIFDVHFVRSPIAGRVELCPIAPLQDRNASMGASMFFAALGRPLPIGRRGYAAKNELLGMTLRDREDSPPIHLVLMADWWIDQIRVDVGVGERVERGQVIAKIHMGSQVDLWTPRGAYRLNCAVGDHVVAGTDALGVSSVSPPPALGLGSTRPVHGSQR